MYTAQGKLLTSGQTGAPSNILAPSVTPGRACSHLHGRTRRRVQTHIFPFSSPPKPSAEGKPEKPSQPAADSNPAPGATPPASSPDGLVTQSAYKFQLPLAVSLAGAAFEAYYEPVGAEGFQEMTVNKTETTYTDSEFLAEVFQGVLHVELLSASGLRAADITGTSDPYAVVSVGPSTAWSKVISRNLNPVWNESLFVYVRDFAQDTLQVRLYDKDLIPPDDDLGLVRVALNTLNDKQANELTLPLRGPDAKGEVRLRITLLPFSKHMLDVMTSEDKVMAGATGRDATASDKVQQQLLQAATGGEQQQDQMQKQGGLAFPGQLDVEKLKETLSSALEKAGLLGSKEGQVTKEEVAANPWKVLARMAGCSRSHTWQPVAFVENKESETQAWVYRSKETREVVISWRGTEQIKWKDLVTDMNLVPASFDIERVDDNAGKPLLAVLFQAALPSEKFLIHSGFLSSYDSIKPQIFRLLDMIMKPKPGENEHLGAWRVYVTGHSLGGALATLCAYELAGRRSASPSHMYTPVTMYTYGAPRVGNKVFADDFNKRVPDSWRITNTNDIVPTVPRLLGYSHVKHSVRLGANGELRIQDDAGVDVFGEGRGGLDVLQELSEKLQDKDGTWDETYEQIAQKEMAILDNLVSGKALEEHMEDFYLAALEQVVVSNAAGSGTAPDATQEKTA